MEGNTNDYMDLNERQITVKLYKHYGRYFRVNLINKKPPMIIKFSYENQGDKHHLKVYYSYDHLQPGPDNKSKCVALVSQDS